MRITEEEIQLLRNIFGGNEKAVMVLRKIFLPEIMPYNPLMENIDLWMALDVRGMTPEQALINIKARNETINHVESCLAQINALANSKNETPKELESKKKANSAR